MKRFISSSFKIGRTREAGHDKSDNIAAATNVNPPPFCATDATYTQAESRGCKPPRIVYVGIQSRVLRGPHRRRYASKDIIETRYRDLLDTLVVLRPVVTEPTLCRFASSRLTLLGRESAREGHTKDGDAK